MNLLIIPTSHALAFQVETVPQAAPNHIFSSKFSIFKAWLVLILRYRCRFGNALCYLGTLEEAKISIVMRSKKQDRRLAGIVGDS